MDVATIIITIIIYIFLIISVIIFRDIISGVLYVVDVGTDVALAVHFFNEGDVYWGRWTLAFIIIPWILHFTYFLYNCGRGDPHTTCCGFLLALFNL